MARTSFAADLTHSPAVGTRTAEFRRLGKRPSRAVPWIESTASRAGRSSYSLTLILRLIVHGHAIAGRLERWTKLAHGCRYGAAAQGLSSEVVRYCSQNRFWLIQRDQIKPWPRITEDPDICRASSSVTSSRPRGSGIASSNGRRAVGKHAWHRRQVADVAIDHAEQPDGGLVDAVRIAHAFASRINLRGRPIKPTISASPT